MIFGAPSGKESTDLQPSVFPPTLVENENSIDVLVTREIGLPWFTIRLASGHTEELEPDETRNWFKIRGANPDAVERMLDHVWNFGKSVATIVNPRKVPLSDPSVQPDIGDV